MLAPVTLVLGGARSGKSRHAEALVESQPGPCIYIATAEARDAEMAARIRHHQARRGPRWLTVEEPLDFAPRLEAVAGMGRAVLVECLTLWLTNLMEADRDIEAEGAQLLAALDRLKGPVVLVANEVGLGVVPDNALARRFLDYAGRLNQALAARAEAVVFMTAGIPVPVKFPKPEATEPR